MGLKINKEKTKFMKILTSEYRRWAQNLYFGQYKFENVKCISYLETVPNN